MLRSFKYTAPTDASQNHAPGALGTFPNHAAGALDTFPNPASGALRHLGPRATSAPTRGPIRSL